MVFGLCIIISAYYSEDTEAYVLYFLVKVLIEQDILYYSCKLFRPHGLTRGNELFEYSSKMFYFIRVFPILSHICKDQ